MVQILPNNEKPSFSQRLNLGMEALNNLNNQFLQEKKAAQLQQQENEALKRYGIEAQGLTPEMKAKAFQSTLDLQKDKSMYERDRASKIQDQMIEESNKINLENLKFQNLQKLQNEKYDYETKLIGSKPQDTTSKKYEDELKQREETKKTAQSAFNNSARILKKGNIGRGSGIYSYFDNNVARDTGEFNTAVAGLEAMLVDMVSRGALSDSRFEYITKTILPKSTDSDAEIEGKLKSLAEILGLDPSALVGGKAGAIMNEPNEKPTKKLDAKAMGEIRRLSGNDKNEAKRIAKKMGYIIE